jgi:hypothetical protein
VVYLQVSPLWGSHDETWHGQGIRKCSVSCNLPKLSQFFGPCTTPNHLWTKQFMSGTWNSSRVAACVPWNKQACRGRRPRLLSVSKKCLSSARYVTKCGLSNTYKVGQNFGVFLPLLTCSPSVWPSRLLYRRGQKSWKDLWNTLYKKYSTIFL